MNWGRKKPSSASSSSHNSQLISHVFPLSWLSKFKRTSIKAGSKTHKSTNQKEQQHQSLQKVSPRTPNHPTYCCDDKLYTQDTDGFWRLSVNEEGTRGDNVLVVPESYFGNCRSNVKEAATAKQRNQKSSVVKSEVFPENGAAYKDAAKNESLQRTYRRIIEVTEDLHRELDEVNGFRKSVEKELSECELLHVMQMMGRADEKLLCSEPGKNPTAASREFDCYHQGARDGYDTRLEWQMKKDAKIKEVLLKNDKHRKSFHVGKGSSKIRVNSPKTPSKAEACKIKALEDIKKAKMKKKMKELQLDDKAAKLGSFAVVKSSRNAEQDFRDSMLEMIIEKRISRPEELEELLACYLTLNADEYHDLIIKVFRQVWRELEEAQFSHKPLQKH